MAIKSSKRKVSVSYESEGSDNEKEISDEDSEQESYAENDSIEGTTANAGWADSIAKILKTNKPKGKKTLVLSKAKKLTDLALKPVDAGYEVQTQEGDIHREHLPAASKEATTEKSIHKKKKEIASVRKKPNILEKDRERTLSKIATKGVVQLFNAVRKQQKDIDTKLNEAGTLEVKRDKVLKNIDKREFLKVLRGEKQTSGDNLQQKQIPTSSKPKEGEHIWSVLRDDFMMSTHMKDWDKALEVENEMEIEQNIETD